MAQGTLGVHYTDAELEDIVQRIMNKDNPTDKDLEDLDILVDILADRKADQFARGHKA